MHGNRLRLWALAAALLTCSAGCSEEEGVQVGDPAVVDLPRGDRFPMAVSLEAHESLARALRVPDHAAVRGLVQAGEVLEVEGGIRGEIVDLDPSYNLAKIRLEEGEHFGKAFWLDVLRLDIRP